MTILKIDKSLHLPVYQQIVDSVLSRIEDGSLSLGSQIPSINQVANDYNLARETVVKAFKILQELGLIQPVHGKGYFVSSVQFQVKNRVFVLFDTFSAYKEVIYNALKDSFGADTFIDIYFHHFNFKVFEKTIIESIGKYQSYLIIPIDSNQLDRVLSQVPSDKLYLIDIKPVHSSMNYSGVFQNFSEDLFNGLTSAIDLCRKYTRLNLVFRNQITDPPTAIITAYNRYCSAHSIDSQVIRTSLAKRKLTKGEAYIVIDDEDLVYLVENARISGFRLGVDLGIISYNETPLKRIAANGISVVSTNFAEMGSLVAQMVTDKQKKFLYNSFRFINRGSF